MQHLPKQPVVLFQLKSTGGSASFAFSAVSLQTSGSEDMQMVWTSKRGAKAVFIANHATEHRLPLHCDRFSKNIRISRLKYSRRASPKRFTHSLPRC